MKYNRRSIMHNAWRFFRKGVETFALALRMAWANAKAHNEAKAAAGVNLADPSTKKGTRLTAYFGASQVQPISA